jgi:hypothetical protein
MSRPCENSCLTRRREYHKSDPRTVNSAQRFRQFSNADGRALGGSLAININALEIMYSRAAGIPQCQNINDARE